MSAPARTTRPAPVDTSTIDDAWPRATLPPTPLEALVADVRRRRDGRAARSQVQLRAAVVGMMESMDVRSLRVGDVSVKLGPNRLYRTVDGAYEVRSAPLVVKLVPPPKPPLPETEDLALVGDVLRVALAGGVVRDVASAPAHGVAPATGLDASKLN